MFKFFKLLVLVLVSGLAGLTLSVFFADRLASQLSRVAIFNDYKLVTSKAPIVIRTTEQVFSRGDEDVLSALEKSKRTVSSLVSRESGQLKLVGNLVNLTSEGFFLGSVPPDFSLAEKYVQLTDGSLRLVSESFYDPASGLTIIKTSGGGGVPTASFGDSKKLQPGERVLLVGSGLGADNFKAGVSFINQQEQNPLDLEAGFYNRFITIQSSQSLESGQALVNRDGEIVGIWTGAKLVPSSVASEVVKLFLKDQTAFRRAAFGFAYHAYSDIEGNLFKKQIGSVAVLRVAQGSPAAISGLKAGDEIVAINDRTLSKSDVLEELLLNSEPTKPVTLKIVRGGKEISLSLVPGKL